MNPKISSLHDDLLWPCVSHACGMGEICSDGRRLAVTERSPVVRAAQLGVSREEYGATLPAGDAAYQGYCAALVPAICHYYETVVAAVYDRYYVADTGSGWPPTPPTSADRERTTYEDVRRYASWSERGLTVARTADDVTPNGSTSLILAVEGMDLVHSETQIATLLEVGVRVFALQYNKPNALTAGDCAEISPFGGSGLTRLGLQVVMRLFAAGAVLDLAHSAPRTRTDILDIADEQGYGHQVAYTHGAILEDAAPDRVTRLPGRFLRREEARRIVRMGGIIGLTPANPFIPSLACFADQISRLFRENENGATSVALGTDFGGLPDSALLPEIRSVTDLGRIGAALAERHGFTNSEIDAVLRTNATAWLRRALPKSTA